MNTHKKKYLLAGILCVTLLAGIFAPVKARNLQGLSSEDSSRRVVGLAQQEGDVILLSQLLTGDLSLAGPYASDSVSFSMPVNWRPLGGAQFDLFMNISFNNPVKNVPDTFAGPVGTLTIQFNDIVIGVLSLDQVGDVSHHFEIPQAAMQSKRSDGLMQLRFLLNSGWSCYLNENMLVYIRTSSRITIPHDTLSPDTSLSKFPFPIFQDYSVFKNSALIVIPDKPTAAELQSALTIASGLGNLSSSALTMDLTTIGRITPQQISTENIILVGRAAATLLSSTKELILPMPINNGQFENGSGAPDDGIVEMVNSPWGLGKVVLVVAGNTDAGTVKAAQAISTGALRASSSPNLAVIDHVQSSPVPISTPTDQTFADLGYGTVGLVDMGVNFATYSFYIPPGQTVADDAYLELLYGHSALLQFDSSGMVVRLNSKPIGSIAMTKESAGQAINRAQISIPKAAIVTGYNRLEIRVNLMPVDRCVNPDLNGLYANIWPESRLFLPLTPISVNPISTYDLTFYPAPYAYNPALDNTAFVLQQDSLSSWKMAFNIASYLGDRSNGPVTSLVVFYGDNIPEAERSKYNFIIIGRPSQMPIIGEINNELPAPFAGKSDIANEPQFQVNYRIDPNATFGYIEMLPSPWNRDNVIVAALGNTDKGVDSAAFYLMEPQSFALAGNFAIINDKQVLTADTRLTTITPGDFSNEPQNVQVIPPDVVDITPAPPYRPTWILPALFSSIGLTVVILFGAIINAWRHARSNRKTTSLENVSDSNEH